MNPRATAAAALREWQRLDWPRTILAIVAALASGRALALTQPGLVAGGALLTVFVASQLWFTRERDVPPIYFAAPLFPRDLAIVLSIAPCGVCCGVVAAFLAGAATGIRIDAALWCGAIEAAVACALVMQSARMRSGSAQTAYRSSAIALGAGLLAANLQAGVPAGAFAAGAAVWCTLSGLRETLTRFDPVERLTE
jgi:hypothetical protein